MAIYVLDGADGQTERAMLIKERKKVEAQEENKLLKQRVAKLEAAARSVIGNSYRVSGKSTSIVPTMFLDDLRNAYADSSPERGTEEHR